MIFLSFPRRRESILTIDPAEVYIGKCGCRDDIMKIIKSKSFDSQKIVEKEFIQQTFIKSTFRETIFQKCTFSECAFEQCDLSNCKVINTSFISSTFHNCKMIGINWTVAAWTPLMTLACDGCDLSFSNFNLLKLQHMILKNCIAKEVDFAGADLTKADFRKTDFLGARFLHTNCTEANLAGSTNYGIDVNINTVKKAKFSLPEALALLQPFDIKIVDSEL